MATARKTISGIIEYCLDIQRLVQGYFKDDCEYDVYFGIKHHQEIFSVECYRIDYDKNMKEHAKINVSFSELHHCPDIVDHVSTSLIKEFARG